MEEELIIFLKIFLIGIEIDFSTFNVSMYEIIYDLTGSVRKRNERPAELAAFIAYYYTNRSKTIGFLF